MKLDLTKPHGVIYGSSNAQYEQGGMCFDGAGNVVEAVESEASEESPADVTKWLSELLSGGPMTQNAVYKEAENAGHPWQDVKSVTGVKKYTYRKADMWKIVPN